MEGSVRDFPIGLSVEMGVNIINLEPLLSLNLSLKWRDVNVKRVLREETLYVYKRNLQKPMLERGIGIKRNITINSV